MKRLIAWNRETIIKSKISRKHKSLKIIRFQKKSAKELTKEKYVNYSMVDGRRAKNGLT